MPTFTVDCASVVPKTLPSVVCVVSVPWFVSPEVPPPVNLQHAGEKKHCSIISQKETPFKAYKVVTLLLHDCFQETNIFTKPNKFHKNDMFLFKNYWLGPFGLLCDPVKSHNTLPQNIVQQT